MFTGFIGGTHVIKSNLSLSEIFVNKLKEIGYSKWISLELFNEKIWKNDPYKVAIDSMASLKKLI